MKKAPIIALSLIMLGSVGTSWVFSASLGSLDIPDSDTTNNNTPAVNSSTTTTEPPMDITENGQQPKTISAKGGHIQNLMDQLSGQLKNLLLTGGPSTARWEIDRNSLVKLIKVFDPQFSDDAVTFGMAPTDFNISTNFLIEGYSWYGLRNGHRNYTPSRQFAWFDTFPDPL